MCSREHCRCQPGQCPPGCDGGPRATLHPQGLRALRVPPLLPFEGPGKCLPPTGASSATCCSSSLRDVGVGVEQASSPALTGVSLSLFVTPGLCGHLPGLSMVLWCFLVLLGPSSPLACLILAPPSAAPSLLSSQARGGLLSGQDALLHSQLAWGEGAFEHVFNSPLQQSPWAQTDGQRAHPISSTAPAAQGFSTTCWTPPTSEQASWEPLPPLGPSRVSSSFTASCWLSVQEQDRAVYPSLVHLPDEEAEGRASPQSCAAPGLGGGPAGYRKQGRTRTEAPHPSVALSSTCPKHTSFCSSLCQPTAPRSPLSLLAQLYCPLSRNPRLSLHQPRSPGLSGIVPKWGESLGGRNTQGLGDPKHRPCCALVE